MKNINSNTCGTFFSVCRENKSWKSHTTHVGSGEGTQENFQPTHSKVSIVIFYFTLLLDRYLIHFLTRHRVRPTAMMPIWNVAGFLLGAGKISVF